MTQGIESSFEADACEFDMMAVGSLLHECAHDIVGDHVHEQLPVDHVWGEAAKHVHGEGDFDFSEAQFDAPAPEVEIGKIHQREILGVEQSGNHGNAAGAEALLGDVEFDEAHGECCGNVIELFLGNVLRANRRFAPDLQSVV